MGADGPGRYVDAITHFRRRSCRRLAAVSRAGRTGRLRGNGAAAAVERIEKRQLESAGPRSRWSSPVVAGNRVWLTTAVDDGDVSLRALAFDVETGRQVVNTEVFRKRRSLLPNLKNSSASPTPIVEGNHIFRIHLTAPRVDPCLRRPRRASRR